MQVHTGRLNSVRLGPDNMALTVSDDYTARAWDLRTGKCKHVFKGALRPHSLEGHPWRSNCACKHFEGRCGQDQAMSSSSPLT